MIFNDTTDDNQGLIQDIDFLLWGTSDKQNSDYSIEDRTRNINIAYNEAVTQLLKADPHWQWDDKNKKDLPIVYTDLSAGKDHYTFPADLTIIHRVRVKNKQGNYKTLEPTTRKQLSDSELKSTGTPEKYYKLDNAVFPVPEPDYSNTNRGIEVQIQRTPSYFDKNDTDKEPGFAKQFHQYLSVVAALRYAESNTMQTKAEYLRNKKKLLEDSMSEFYERRSKGDNPNLSPERPNVKHYGL